MATMKAAVYYSNRDIRIEERPVPEISSGELLVRIESSGICGSDVMEWYRLKRAPLVLGHEISGVVVEAGRDAGRAASGDRAGPFHEGDRVFASHHVPCNTCRYCLAGQHSLCDTLRSTNFDPGGFAQFVRVPAINVGTGTYRLPEGLSFDEGSFIEPLACVLRGLRIARFRAGWSALVLGSGISGLLFVKALRQRGAGRIVTTDLEPYRLEAARRFGADAALFASDATPGKLGALNSGRLFDFVVTCAGERGVVLQALQSVDRGATVLLFAPLARGTEVSIPFFRVWRDQITILSTYAGCPQDIEEAIELLRTPGFAVADMITHRLPLAETAEGFRLVAEGRESIKVIIRPQE
jgi:L-iditol 2-dehydrogenase